MSSSRLSWLLVSFWAHAQYFVYRIVSFKAVINNILAFIYWARYCWKPPWWKI